MSDTYGTAARAALEVLRTEYDERTAKDKANAVGACAHSIAIGTITVADLKHPDDPAMVAGLKAVGLR